MSPAALPASIAGHTAIITGGARGFGLGIARRLAGGGCRAILWDRDFNGFDPAAAGFTPHAQHVVDVADAAAVSDAFDAAVASAGRIEILVNNAGINGPVLPCWDYPVDAWRRVLGIDLDGVFHGCRAAIPHMRENGYGRIVNIASIAGKEGNPNGSGYAAAKGGVIAFSKSAAKEVAGTGILINCIAPSIAETELLNQLTPEFIAAMKAKVPLGRFVQVEEVAELVAWVASPACSFTTGFTFDLTGGRATY